jgi:hypothetical protein
MSLAIEVIDGRTVDHINALLGPDWQIGMIIPLSRRDWR